MQEPEETHVQFLGQEDPLEEEMTTHSSILAGTIPWTEQPGGLYGVAYSWTQLSTCVCKKDGEKREDRCGTLGSREQREDEFPRLSL